MYERIYVRAPAVLYEKYDVKEIVKIPLPMYTCVYIYMILV